MHQSLDVLPSNVKYDFVVTGGQSAFLKYTKLCFDLNKVARAAR